MHFGLSYALILLWLAYLLVAGVYLFSRGFLLSRVSKSSFSQCTRIGSNHSEDNYLTENVARKLLEDVGLSYKTCLPQKSRIIILLVDALKYEFGLFRDREKNVTLPFENRLTVMHELLQNKPQQTRILRFKADPPTTTLQRLKGLTTGSLPTFIDIGSNFATPEINEDNIIDQLVRQEMSMVFMGDATWTELYPRRFKRFYSYPSFDIFDLDTVDQNVRIHLKGEIEKNDWQVLIAHLLGIDHCGHRYGMMHTEMSRKLDEVNDLIRKVINQLDERTTLLVMGDHGMTMSGDHGGDTDDETDALLFAYTSLKEGFFSNVYASDNQTMQQIDLVPTMAATLGVPIPYSNLGLINFNLIPNITVPNLNRYQVLLLHIWQNVEQITLYFREYTMENSRSFSFEELDDLKTKYLQLKQRAKTVYTEAAFKSLIVDINSYMRSILNICRKIWVKFDPTQMSQGLLITFLSIFFCFILINNVYPSTFQNLFYLRKVGYIYLLNFAAAIFGYRYYKNLAFKTEEHAVIFLTSNVSSLIFIYHIAYNWSEISLNWSKMSKFQNMPARIIFTIVISIYFSNSFIIQEGKVLAYLLVASVSLLIFDLWKYSLSTITFKQRFRWQQLFKLTAAKLCIIAFASTLILVKSATMLFRCRSEQSNCLDLKSDYNDQVFNNNVSINSEFTSPNSNTQVDISAMRLLPVITMCIYVSIARLYFRFCGNLTGQSLNVLLARYGSTICAICLSGYMILNSNFQLNTQRSHIDIMACVVYLALLIQITVIFIDPLMVYVISVNNRNVVRTISTPQINGYIPELFNRIKYLYQEQIEQRTLNQSVPAVYGMATIYSSIIMSFGVFLSLVLILLLDAQASMGIILCLALAIILLVVHSLISYNCSGNFENCVQPRFNALIAWILLTQFCFFATSHQTTLSQIEWKAAFVGRTVGIGQSKALSAILVLVNTFCGQILFFSLYSLLSINTVSLLVLFPKLNWLCTSKNKRLIQTLEASLDISHGELLLYENKHCFTDVLFKLACQFYMLQGLKMFCSMLACTIHCRHLMVWKIFAPRFIYEILTTCITLAAIIIGFLLVARIHKAVDSLMISLKKLK